MDKRLRILILNVFLVSFLLSGFLYPVLADDDSAITGETIILTINWLEDTPKERPESIKVELYRTVDGEDVPMDSKTITKADAISANTWQVSFEYYYGQVWEYAFKINESVPQTALYSYQLIESGNGTDHYVFDFVYGHGSTTMTIQTVWDDNNNALGLRPESVTVDLFSFSGDQVPERSILLTGDETARSWTATVEGLKDDPSNYYIVLNGLPERYENLVTRGSEDSIYISTNTLIEASDDKEVQREENSAERVANTLTGIASTVNMERLKGQGLFSRLWIPILIIFVLVGLPTAVVYLKRKKDKRDD